MSKRGWFGWGESRLTTRAKSSDICIWVLSVTLSRMQLAMCVMASVLLLFTRFLVVILETFRVDPSLRNDAWDLGSFKFWQLITRDGSQRTLAIRRYQFAADLCRLEDPPGKVREPTDLKHDVDPKARFVGYCAKACARNPLT